MKISGAIKRYMEGILLVLLAGFILGAVQYVISIIPETTIPPSNNNASSTNPYLVDSITGSVSNDVRTGVIYKWLSYSPKYTLYVVVDTSSLNPPAYATAIRIYLSNGDVIYVAMYRYNDFISYLDVSLNGRSIQAIQVDFNTATSGDITISFYDAPSINDALGWEPTPSNPSISNKLILSFISWIAGIVLIIQAMHKFGIPI
jgi:hypothetical protein